MDVSGYVVRRIRKRILSDDLLCRRVGERDLKAGDPVGIGFERKRAAMLDQDFADEEQPDSLPVGFGGKERGKEFRLRLRSDTLAVVGNFQHGRVGGGSHADAAVAAPGLLDALDGILEDIDHDLFEERPVQFDLQHLGW